MMKEILKQLVTIWRDLKPFQKTATGLILIFVAASMSFMFFRSSGSNFIPLFQGKTLSNDELGEIRAYLNHFSIPFEEDKEKKIRVCAEHADQIRMELAAAGIPKHEQRKGFELFDTNTWVKGEKELEVLEMRALKGQLEKDLAGFEHIKSASVILDIPPQRNFSGTKYQTKASVILTLMPQVRLHSSELRAITNHLAGAVRGLEPHMIAISDTTGKLYKALDPDAGEEMFHNAQIFFEERVEEKVISLLRTLVNDESFYSTVQAVLDKQTDEIQSLSIGVIIDEAALGEVDESVFKAEIERQLAAIGSGYGMEIEPVVDVLPFEKKRKVWSEKKQKVSYPGIFFTALFLVLALLALFPIVRRHKKNKDEEEESLFQVMTRIDVKMLTDSIQNEDPATIALMLSYLEPKKAEQMILSLKTDVQEEVLYHLSELEKEGL